MSIRILIVDDDEFNRRLLRDMLVASGMEIAGEAVNGREAIMKYAEEKPDVVLMDIMMPLVNGVEATREIVRKDPSAKIIVCSAIEQESRAIEAIDAGAKEFLSKPFRTASVTQAIRGVLATNL